MDKETLYAREGRYKARLEEVRDKIKGKIKEDKELAKKYPEGYVTKEIVWKEGSKGQFAFGLILIFIGIVNTAMILGAEYCLDKVYPSLSYNILNSFADNFFVEFGAFVTLLVIAIGLFMALSTWFPDRKKIYKIVGGKRK